MEYDSVNRLVKYNGKEVRYDKDGNMTYGPLEGEMATFTYDCRNRLTEVTTDSGKTTQYQYDAENNRTAVIKNAGTTQETKTAYVVDSTSNELTRVLQVTTVSRSGETDKVLYTYGNGLIAQEKTEKLSNAETEVPGAAQNERKEYLLYHFNHIGSTTAVTDEAGAVKYTHTYSIYGELLSGNYGEVEFLYNGQYGVTSNDNGLYYMRARYYNIDIKRFINQDILTGSIDSSQSLNRYAYVEGNPVNFLDPFGLEKSDNDDLHKFYQNVGKACTGVGVIALIVAAASIVLTFGVAGAPTAAVAAGLGTVTTTTSTAAAATSIGTIAAGVGVGSAIVDGGLYVEDYYNAKSYNARINAIDGLTKTVVTTTIDSAIGQIGEWIGYIIDNVIIRALIQAVSDNTSYIAEQFEG